MSSISLSLASYAEDASVPLLADMEKKEADGFTRQLWPSATSLLSSLSSTGVEYGQSGLLVGDWEKGANCINNDKAVWGQTSLQPRPLHPPPPKLLGINKTLFRFKTEICRNFKEKGTCLYGELCQFAHGK